MGKAILRLGKPFIFALPVPHAVMNDGEIIARHPLVDGIDVGLNLRVGRLNACSSCQRVTNRPAHGCGRIARPRLRGQAAEQVSLLIVAEEVSAQAAVQRIS